MPATSPPPAPSADERCGRWLLGRTIATGAWAEVRAARAAGAPGAAEDGEPVAIKRPHSHAARDAAFTELFAAERALTATLPAHPALITAIEHGDGGPADDARAYLVMPRIDGPDLRARLAQGAIARPVWLAVAADLAAALAHLHAHGWVHGDVNPSNVLLGSRGAVLCDLGVARRVDAAGPVRGTPAYMAPEQVKGEPWTAAVDVFALGVVLWELSAGARLFARPAPYLAMAAIVETPAPPLADPPLAALVAAALSREPGARPPAGDVAALLRALL
ncbi:MAG TPA: protein kinase [Kofleriaceae bacterium]|nr:protein kinase [Kofleriaceae bacterium]